MSKKLKFGIIFITLMIIIGLIFGILTLYRFYIIQKILKKTENNIEINNYYLKTTLTKGENKSITEAFYRDGVGKLVAQNGIYTWADGENAYMINENNKTVYILDINNENMGLVSHEMFASFIPIYSKNFFEKFVIAGDLKNTIKSTKMDNEKCYMIKILEEKVTKTVWISKNKCVPIRAEIKFQNGDVFIYEYEIKFNSINLKDIELPDIEEYKVINYETKEIILDNFKVGNTINNV